MRRKLQVSHPTATLTCGAVMGGGAPWTLPVLTSPPSPLTPAALASKLNRVPELCGT